jgi:hypothetical protein
MVRRQRYNLPAGPSEISCRAETAVQTALQTITGIQRFAEHF